jgi:GNAT superfamily N-acetyltransferase
MSFQIIEFPSEEYSWQLYLDHLGLIDKDTVIGHLSLKKQPISVPSSFLTNHQDWILLDTQSNPLYEMFVQSFAVEEIYQQKGYGRALQESGLQKTKEFGCYQMRSWSSADRRENYALKISMKFSIQPALYPTPGGAPLSGVYFTKRV